MISDLNGSLGSRQFLNVANKRTYFFPSGHGNEFCNLIGS